MIDHLFAFLLPSIQQGHLFGYWIAFFAALIETVLLVGLVIPGSTILLLLGAASAAGHLDFVGLMWTAVAGAILGDNLNYWLGRRYGARWTRSGIWILTPDHFQKAHAFFERHGAKSVFLSRFVPSLKEIAPFVAGSVQMRGGPFMLWNILGGIGWGLQWVGGGYLFGKSLEIAQTWMTRIGFAATAILLLWAAIWLVRRLAIARADQVIFGVRRLSQGARRFFAQNGAAQRFISAHPRLVAFAAARFSRGHFSGLPLTALGLVFTYTFLLLVGLVEDVVTADPVVRFDMAVSQVVAALRFPELTAIFVWITSLGEPPIVIGLVAMVALLFWRSGHRWKILPLLISLGGSAATSVLGKLAVHRARPVDAVLLETSYSFPSGHATVAVACYGMLAYLLVRGQITRNARIHMTLGALLLIFAIAASRVVLGVHYLSDVWAGLLVGTLWLMIGMAFAEWLAATGRIDWTRPHRIPGLMVTGFAALWVGGIILLATTQTLPEVVHSNVAATVLDRSLTHVLAAERLTHTRSLFGDRGQPLSIAVVAANDTGLAKLVERAGWLPADRPSVRNLVRLARDGLQYETAPVAPAFWNDRINGLAFERAARTATGRVIQTVRLWRTRYRVDSDAVYVGVARTYDGVQWGLMHTIQQDVDAAARSFAQSLTDAVPGVAGCSLSLTRPQRKETLLDQTYFSSGTMWLIGAPQVINGPLFCGAEKPAP